MVDLTEQNLVKTERLSKTRKKSPLFEELKVFLFQWFNAVHATDNPINDPIFKVKATEIAFKLRIHGFTVSNG